MGFPAGVEYLVTLHIGEISGRIDLERSIPGVIMVAPLAILDAEEPIALDHQIRPGPGLYFRTGREIRRNAEH